MFFYCRCAHRHSTFPNTSIALYYSKKFLCKIGYRPVYMEKIRYYLVKQEYKDTSDRIALAPGLDHSSLFNTQIGSWEEVKATCDKHNALFYQPDHEETFFYIHQRYGFEIFHSGMFLEDGKWKTCRGTEITVFFWGLDEPTAKGQKCGGISSRSKLVDNRCDTLRKGLCIY